MLFGGEQSVEDEALRSQSKREHQRLSQCKLVVV